MVNVFGLDFSALLLFNIFIEGKELFFSMELKITCIEEFVIMKNIQVGF